jgi:hypothetical protein
MCRQPLRAIFVHEAAFDLTQDLSASQIGDQFFIQHQLEPSVYKLHEKSIPNSIAIDFWPKIVHRIVHGIVLKIVRVDGPLPF